MRDAIFEYWVKPRAIAFIVAVPLFLLLLLSHYIWPDAAFWHQNDNAPTVQVQ